MACKTWWTKSTTCPRAEPQDHTYAPTIPVSCKASRQPHFCRSASQDISWPPRTRNQSSPPVPNPPATCAPSRLRNKGYCSPPGDKTSPRCQAPPAPEGLSPTSNTLTVRGGRLTPEKNNKATVATPIDKTIITGGDQPPQQRNRSTTEKTAADVQWRMGQKI